MREVRALDVEARFFNFLDDVERGETIIICRNGKPIARMVPETQVSRSQIAGVLAEIDEFRKTMPRISLEEILSGRRDGRDL